VERSEPQSIDVLFDLQARKEIQVKPLSLGWIEEDRDELVRFLAGFVRAKPQSARQQN